MANDNEKLTMHIHSLESITADLKMQAWQMFDYEWEKGRSAYAGNLLAGIGGKCDLITRTTREIVLMGDMLAEELRKYEVSNANPSGL